MLIERSTLCAAHTLKRHAVCFTDRVYSAVTRQEHDLSLYQAVKQAQGRVASRQAGPSAFVCHRFSEQRCICALGAWRSCLPPALAVQQTE